MARTQKKQLPSLRGAAAEKRSSTAGQRRTKVNELKISSGLGRGRARGMVSYGTSPIVHRPVGKGQRGGPMYGPTYEMTVQTQGKRPTVRKYK